MISYCVMPDHYHLVVKILKEAIFSKYINDLENSYTRYFNVKFDRKGPLWQNSYKAVRIKTNEQQPFIQPKRLKNMALKQLRD